MLLAFALSGLAVGTSVVGSAAEADEETTIAKSLAAMVNAALAVISKNQDHIDNATIGNKGLDGKTVLAQAQQAFQEATGADPLKIDPNSRHGRLLGIEMNAIVEIMEANQKSINQSGIGFKGFIPSTFGRLIIERFSKARRGMPKSRSPPHRNWFGTESPDPTLGEPASFARNSCRQVGPKGKSTPRPPKAGRRRSALWYRCIIGVLSALPRSPKGETT